ncbi:MAG: response regulator [Bacteroidia bacterium]|nr:response regulator [Bacteroidia bacterium]
MSDSRFPLCMIVDDNELDCFILKKLIEANNFSAEAIALSDARSALDYLKANSGNSEKLPRIIFLDIMMPGMDGFEFLDEFEKLSETVRNTCRVVLISTSESFKDLNRANKSKFVFRFLNKPITEEMLANISG